MAKVHPQPPSAAVLPALPGSCMISSRRESFTVWMKSLVMHGNGYTVYNSDGQIVYRIDNYHNNSSSEVYLMDLHGKVIFTILRRKLRVFGRWEGYKWNGSKMEKQMKPCFQVRKHWRILGYGGSSTCEVTVRPNGAQSAAGSCHYRLIQGYAGKSTLIRIVDSEGGGVMAEVKQKQASTGVALGDDVLNLVVEPHVDHSLVMALVAVSALIHHRI